MNEYLQDEREIKGFVEIEYSNIVSYPKIATYQEFPKSADFCGQDRFDLNTSTNPPGRISKNYASLENNYFQLDGSFVLPYKSEFANIDAGYISEEILDTYNLKATYDYNLQIMGETEPYVFGVNGLTIYFKDNVPNNIYIKVTDKFGEITEFNLTSNDIEDEKLSVKFDDKIYLYEVEYTFYNMEYSDRRLRISCIDLGLTDVIKNYRLKDFTLTDQIDEYNIETPSSQLIVNIDNTNKKFDIANPTGIAEYLQENRIVKPRIGILTENKGIEYKHLGYYFLTEWQNNSDNTTTITCSDRIQSLKNMPFKQKIGPNKYSNSNLLNDFFSDNFEIYDVLNFYQGEEENYYDDSYVDTEYALDYIQMAIVYMGGKLFKIPSEFGLNQYELKMFYEGTYDGGKLTRNVSLLNEPIYKQKEKIKNINIVKYLGFQNDNYITETYTKKINEIGKELNIDNKLFKNFGGSGTVESLNSRCEKVANKIAENMYDYEISFNYIGDPKMMVGANVTIETRYGERNMKVLKHTLTYNGGLTGSIEGVGN